MVDPHNIEVFFKDPRIDPSFPDDFGTLYLLRRDIKSCIDAKILWPSSMCIMAGIDLLGKYLEGKDSLGGSRKRFCSFAVTYFHLPLSEAETLYQLRNSLLHSFGLISKVKSPHCRFQLQATGSPILIFPIALNCFNVDLICLYDRFEKAVSDYHHDLLGSAALRRNFASMFPIYGKIPID